jgi:hypothetical protein
MSSRTVPERTLIVVVAWLLAVLAAGAAAHASVNTNPVFTNPSSVTNPLFPASKLDQLVHLGVEAGEPSRFEVTRLPGTKAITLGGRTVRALQVQFLASSDSTIVEVATDYFAQADDGTVWYLGENVSNYENGVVANHDGTWVTGTRRPDGKLFAPGVIMPAKPAVGDVFFPEDNKPFVFEKVTVKATGLTLGNGPRGPIKGALKTREDLLDGSSEEKLFAPGYGEFSARVPFGAANPEELTNVAVAAPIDRAGTSLPSQLSTMARAADAGFAAIDESSWTGAKQQLATLTTAWRSHRAALTAGKLVPLLVEQMDDALATLTDAVNAHAKAKALQAVVRAAKAVDDLELRYLPAARVDLARLDAWARQALVDIDQHDSAGLRGDSAYLDQVWTRVRHTVASTPRATIDTELKDLGAAAKDKRFATAETIADRLRATLRSL